MTDAIEIRLRGEGIQPGLVRSGELAEILEAVEDFITAETLRRDPTVRREDIVVGLYEIADKSIGLRFKTSFAAIVLPAFAAASQALAQGDFSELSPQSFKPLQVLWNFSKRHDSVTEFKFADTDEPLATIEASTVLPQPAKIRGSTELVAKVLRVGGKVPRAMLEMPDGTVIYCNVEQELAIDLGHQLYTMATLTGDAVWDAGTFELEEFSITGFKGFPGNDPYEALTRLRDYIEPNERMTSYLSYVRRGEDD